MSHRAEEEYVYHQGDIPFRALPGSCRKPNGDTHDGDDIGAVLRTCGEKNGEHQHGGQQRLTEGLVAILLQTQIRQGKGNEPRNHQPEVGIVGTTSDFTDDTQQGDVLVGGE